MTRAATAVGLVMLTVACTSATQFGRVDVWVAHAVAEATVVDVARDDDLSVVTLDVTRQLVPNDDGRHVPLGSVTLDTSRDPGVAIGDAVTVWASLDQTGDGPDDGGLSLVIRADGTPVAAFVEPASTADAVNRLSDAGPLLPLLQELTEAVSTGVGTLSCQDPPPGQAAKALCDD